MEEDLPYAVRLFEDTPPFLLSQILGLRVDQWLAIEAAEKKDMEKQRGGVLQSWGRSGDSAKWSALVEALIIVGLRSKAQAACIEKGKPMYLRLFYFSCAHAKHSEGMQLGTLTNNFHCVHS